MTYKQINFWTWSFRPFIRLPSGSGNTHDKEQKIIAGPSPAVFPAQALLFFEHWTSSSAWKGRSSSSPVERTPLPLPNYTSFVSGAETFQKALNHFYENSWHTSNKDTGLSNYAEKWHSTLAYSKLLRTFLLKPMVAQRYTGRERNKSKSRFWAGKLHPSYWTSENMSTITLKILAKLISTSFASK